MIWQDVLLAVGGFGFSLALIPTIKGKSKPAWTTSLMTGIILSSFTVAYATLGLWLACVSTTITSGCWFTLLFQAVRKENKEVTNG